LEPEEMKTFCCATILIAARVVVCSQAKVYMTSAFSPFSTIHKKNVSKTSLNLSPAIMVRGGVSASDAVLKSFYGDALGESIIM